MIIVMQTGHAVSPFFRFLASSGDWVWMQMEGTVFYASDKTTTQSYIEYKAVVLGYDCACIVTTIPIQQMWYATAIIIIVIAFTLHHNR